MVGTLLSCLITKVSGKRSSQKARIKKKQKRARKRALEKARILDLLEQHLANQRNVGAEELPGLVEEEGDILILEANEFSESELESF